jgi:hypothetical protein
VPRCTSAIVPAGNPAKSEASQPLVDVLSGCVPIGTTGSTGVIRAETSPPALYFSTFVSPVNPAGAGLTSSDGLSAAVNGKRNCWTRTR